MGDTIIEPRALVYVILCDTIEPLYYRSWRRRKLTCQIAWNTLRTIWEVGWKLIRAGHKWQLLRQSIIVWKGQSQKIFEPFFASKKDTTGASHEQAKTGQQNLFAQKVCPHSRLLPGHNVGLVKWLRGHMSSLTLTTRTQCLHCHPVVKKLYQRSHWQPGHNNDYVDIYNTIWKPLMDVSQCHEIFFLFF